jgi:hypothetical protein
MTSWKPDYIHDGAAILWLSGRLRHGGEATRSTNWKRRFKEAGRSWILWIWHTALLARAIPKNAGERGYGRTKEYSYRSSCQFRSTLARSVAGSGAEGLPCSKQCRMNFVLRNQSGTLQTEPSQVTRTTLEAQKHKREREVWWKAPSAGSAGLEWPAPTRRPRSRRMLPTYHPQQTEVRFLLLWVN